MQIDASAPATTLKISGCCLALGFAMIAPRSLPAQPPVTAVEISAAQLPGFDGVAIDDLSLLDCSANGCRPVLFQVDERTADGQWVLSEGPSPIRDQPAGILDGNDLLLLQGEIEGERRLDADDLPPHRAALAIEVIDAVGGTRRWVHLIATSEAVARASRVVEYDAATDHLRGERVGLGFRNGIPNRLTLMSNGENLIDRFKVRAQASLVFGLLRFQRSEADITTELVGWQRGPLRIIRYQRQRVRLGWGIRSPIFSVHTFFHRDFAELPVALWLNAPPTYFFTDIQLEVLLDFRNLDGWQLELPQGTRPASDESKVEQLFDSDWFALRNESLTLLTVLHVSRSLDPARRQLVVRSSDQPQPPESVVGEHPAIGYRLDRWQDVGAGAHGLKAVTYALPASVDVPRFLASLNRFRVGRIDAISDSLGSSTKEPSE